MIKEKENIEPQSKNRKQNVIIAIKDLHKTFGEDNEVLKGINLNLHKGEDLVILGRSGSGKSVTIKCIVGLIAPDKGEIAVFDENILELKKMNLTK